MSIDKIASFLAYGNLILLAVFAFTIIPSQILDTIEKFRDFRKHSKEKH